MASKYRAVPVTVDGIRFASKAEARRYQELKALERAGKIANLVLQPSYPLHGGVAYRADFAYDQDGRRVVEDVKGYETQVFRIKAKLFRADYPDLDFRIVRA